MCEPTSIAVAGFALGAAGEILDHKGKQQQSKAVRKEAVRDAAQQVNTINLRQSQEAQAAQNEIGTIERNRQSAVAAASVSAAEAGVQGASVDALMHDIGFDASTLQGDVRLNLKNTTEQLNREKVAVAAQRDSRIAGAPAPNPFATALRIGTGAVGMFSALQNRKP